MTHGQLYPNPHPSPINNGTHVQYRSKLCGFFQTLTWAIFPEQMKYTTVNTPFFAWQESRNAKSRTSFWLMNPKKWLSFLFCFPPWRQQCIQFSPPPIWWRKPHVSACWLQLGRKSNCRPTYRLGLETLPKHPKPKSSITWRLAEHTLDVIGKLICV